jgi:hypothetical protein
MQNVAEEYGIGRVAFREWKMNCPVKAWNENLEEKV